MDQAISISQIMGSDEISRVRSLCALQVQPRGVNPKPELDVGRFHWTGILFMHITNNPVLQQKTSPHLLRHSMKFFVLQKSYLLTPIMVDHGFQCYPIYPVCSCLQHFDGSAAQHPPGHHSFHITSKLSIWSKRCGDRTCSFDSS